VPILARKPGALRNGAPFKDWVLPAALERVRRKLAGSDDGDRHDLKIKTLGFADIDPGKRAGEHLIGYPRNESTAWRAASPSGTRSVPFPGVKRLSGVIRVLSDGLPDRDRNRQF